MRMILKHAISTRQRLDFLEFEMNSGSKFDSPCDQDSFEILSTGVLDLGVGRLCGRNTGQAGVPSFVMFQCCEADFCPYQ